MLWGVVETFAPLKKDRKRRFLPLFPPFSVINNCLSSSRKPSAKVVYMATAADDADMDDVGDRELVPAPSPSMWPSKSDKTPKRAAPSSFTRVHTVAKSTSGDRGKGKTAEPSPEESDEENSDNIQPFVKSESSFPQPLFIPDSDEEGEVKPSPKPHRVLSAVHLPVSMRFVAFNFCFFYCLAYHSSDSPVDSNSDDENNAAEFVFLSSFALVERVF